MSTNTSSPVVEIANAMAAYIKANLAQLSVAVDRVEVGPLVILPLEQAGTEAKVYLDWRFTATTHDGGDGATREDRGERYTVDIQVVDYTQFGTVEEAQDLSLLLSEIRDLLNEVPMAGREFWEFAASQPVEEVDLDELEESHLFRTVLPVTYLDFI